jgi:hypothetical protein
MRLRLTLMTAWLAVAASAQETAAPAGPYAPQIAELGSDDFRVRERAHQRLRDAGGEAKAALESAAEDSTDAEVRQRAEILLRRLNAGPRVASAMAKLDSAQWEEVKAALYALCDEYGEETGAEDAVRKASDGKGQAARMARVLNQQWDNWARQQQQFMRNISFQNAQFLQQYYANLKLNMKHSSVDFMCKREFDQLHAKDKDKDKEKGQEKAQVRVQIQEVKEVQVKKLR